MSKPPLGLVPKHIHDNNRAIQIVEAIHRYLLEFKPVPEEWTRELYSICKREERKA